MKNFLAAGFILCCFAAPAHAQRFDGYQMNQRLSQIEQQLLYLQQQSANTGVVHSGQVGAEIGRIDEEMRMLRGQIEQTQYQIDQLQKQLTALQEDFEYRFQEIEGGKPPKVSDSEPETTDDGDLTSDLRAIVGGTSAPQDLQPPADGLDSPRSLYNYAFKLLNQTNYDAAQQYFQEFTQQYPSDPLIGNAWYWLGESHYVRRNYVQAADSFRQGFEVLPDGPKAGDNLLKLAMALAALQRNDEACVVLRQVDKKYSRNSEALRDKSRQEINRLGCK